MPADPTSQLATALDATRSVVDGITNEQWDQPTPCAEWNVRQLLQHLVGGNHLFARVLRGEPPASSRDQLGPDAELARAYADSATTVLEAFRQPGALERVVSVPFGSVPGMVALHLRITEVLVHGWDLARATGQKVTFPDDLAEQELAFTRANLPERRADRSPFGSPQPVAEDAPVIDRLAALLGRNVSTTPSVSPGRA